MATHDDFAASPRTPPAPGVPEDTLVYAVGDIHGRLDLLERLHDRIAADAAASPAARKTVVYLGDYVDRGADSRGVIDLLLAAPVPGLEAVHLMGNHEALLLGFLDDAGTAGLWFANGGDDTLLSYGVDPRQAPGADDPPVRLQEAFRRSLPASHLEFLRALRPSFALGDYLFVHAGIRPGVPLDAQDRDDLLWIRDGFLHSDADHGKVVVHGHSATREPEVRANRIGIDTGAVYGGRLTALALHGAERRFLQV